MEFRAYSVRAGQPVSNGLTLLLWTDASARSIIGAILIDLANESGKETVQLGVITDGHLKPLTFPASLPPTDYETIAF